jgi:putative transposase
VVNTAALVATGSTPPGTAGSLAWSWAPPRTAPAGPGSCAASLAPGLAGVKLVASDAHQGLVDAVASVLGGASWQRCRTHFVRNLLVKLPRHAQPMVASLVRTIVAQRPEDAWAWLGRVVEQLRVGRFGDAADLLEAAAADVLADAAFPRGCWRQVWSNDPQERPNREARRRTDVVGVFPDRAAAVGLVAAVLAEQHDERQVTRRYVGAELITATLAIGQPDPPKGGHPSTHPTAA